MTRDAWRELVIRAVLRLHDDGDASAVELLAQLLYEQDQAKARLQRAGFGCTGMPWLDVISEIEHRNHE
jgi:hypothetical protein